MKKTTLSILFVLVFTAVSWAQTTYTWDFETDPVGDGSHLPPGYSHNAWAFPGEWGPGNQHSGTWSYRFDRTGGPQNNGWISSRAFYFSAGSYADISGWLWNSTNGTVELRLEYSTNSTGPWTEFYSSTNYNTHGVWTQETVQFNLTTLGLTEGYYYFRFHMKVNGANTVGYLDDISLQYWGDPPLPVELSAFTAAINASHNVLLTWVTQTETNVAGFRLYRNTSDSFDTALMLNAFIDATNTSSTQIYAYYDEEVFQPGVYYYWLVSEDLDGTSQCYGPVSVSVSSPANNAPPPLLITGINGIYPNPFNPDATVDFTLSSEAGVRILIYNLRGQLLRHLIDETRQPGNHRVHWDGQDDAGQICGNGIYHFVLYAGNHGYSQKALLLK